MLKEGDLSQTVLLLSHVHIEVKKKNKGWMEIDSRLLFLWFQFVISSSKNSEGWNAAQEAWATLRSHPAWEKKGFFCSENQMYVRLLSQGVFSGFPLFIMHIFFHLISSSTLHSHSWIIYTTINNCWTFKKIYL